MVNPFEIETGAEASSYLSEVVNPSEIELGGCESDSRLLDKTKKERYLRDCLNSTDENMLFDTECVNMCTNTGLD